MRNVKHKLKFELRTLAPAAPALLVPVRDETAAWTERIAAVEREIDQRVAALYGLTDAGTVVVPGKA